MFLIRANLENYTDNSSSATSQQLVRVEITIGLRWSYVSGWKLGVYLGLQKRGWGRAMFLKSIVFFKAAK